MILPVISWSRKLSSANQVYKYLNFLFTSALLGPYMAHLFQKTVLMFLASCSSDPSRLKKWLRYCLVSMKYSVQSQSGYLWFCLRFLVILLSLSWIIADPPPSS
jgi:hypothetical protein